MCRLEGEFAKKMINSLIGRICLSYSCNLKLRFHYWIRYDDLYLVLQCAIRCTKYSLCKILEPYLELKNGHVHVSSYSLYDS